MFVFCLEVHCIKNLKKNSNQNKKTCEVNLKPYNQNKTYKYSHSRGILSTIAIMKEKQEFLQTLPLVDSVLSNYRSWFSICPAEETWLFAAGRGFM